MNRICNLSFLLAEPESRLYYDVERGAAKSTGRKNFFSGRTMFPDDFSYKKRRRPVRDAAFRISPVAG